MDIITAKLGANMAISELTASGRVGSATKPVFISDGNPAGKPTVSVGMGGTTYALIAEGTYDLHDIEEVVGYMGDVKLTVSKSELTIEEPGQGVMIASAPINGQSTPIALVYPEIPGQNPEGVFALCDTKINAYVSRIEFAETIHTIDPKYLPAGSGGGLPVVIDLTKYEVAEGLTINDIVLTVFAQGGGNSSGAFPSNFWADVSTDREVKFTLDASALGEPFIIEAGAQFAIKDESGMAVSIETSFLIYTYESWSKVTIVFHAVAGLLVSVAPLA